MQSGMNGIRYDKGCMTEQYDRGQDYRAKTIEPELWNQNYQAIDCAVLNYRAWYERTYYN
jgi:hypothetical protein